MPIVVILLSAMEKIQYTTYCNSNDFVSRKDRHKCSAVSCLAALLSQITVGAFDTCGLSLSIVAAISRSSKLTSMTRLYIVETESDELHRRRFATGNLICKSALRPSGPQEEYLGTLLLLNCKDPVDEVAMVISLWLKAWIRQGYAF